MDRWNAAWKKQAIGSLGTKSKIGPTIYLTFLVGMLQRLSADTHMWATYPGDRVGLYKSTNVVNRAYMPRGFKCQNKQANTGCNQGLMRRCLHEMDVPYGVYAAGTTQSLSSSKPTECVSGDPHAWSSISSYTMSLRYIMSFPLSPLRYSTPFKSLLKRETRTSNLLRTRPGWNMLGRDGY
jgi:hypothetical protein